ncbi:DNA topoisomerase 2-binding protein 1-B, partial [Asbolus verrucosus]
TPIFTVEPIFKVYVAGFRPEQREKLCKILNLSGATRYDDISDRLTHIIIGDASCPEVRMIKSKNIPASLVSLRWLLDSMEKQQAADEDDYLITLNSSGKEQFSSPLSRKGLNLLRSSKTLTSSDVESAGDSSRTLQEPDLMQQYLRSASQSTANSRVSVSSCATLFLPDEETDTLAQLLKADSNFNSRPDLTEEAESSTHRSGSSQALDVFASKKFLIANFAAEESHYIKEQIESAGGTVMSKTYKGIPDFLVAPTFVSSPIQASALEIVNNLWIFESIQEGEECPISYFHRPLLVPSTKPLRNSVVTISGYTTFERNFLKELIEELGGDCQEQFARIQCSEKGVSASTHLVSLEASGKKYAAAVKWGLPVVSKEWLLECAKTGRGVPVEDFLIGEAKSAFGKSAGSVVDSTKTTPSEAKRRILTPLNQKQPLDISKTEQTPLAQRLFRGVAETPDPCSQVTPVNKLMEEVRRTNLLGTPQTPPMPKSLYDVDTPESPFGAFIRPHLSPKSKKELMRYINCIPDFVPPPKDRKSTPLSEVKRRCWKKLLGQQQSPGAFAVNRTDASSGGAQEAKGAGEVGAEEVRENGVDGHESVNTEVNTQNVFISTKLKQIEDMVSAIGGSRRESKVFQSTVPQEVGSSNVKESQPFTVGWDYNESMSKDEANDADIKIRTFSPKERQVRIFMLSGVEKDLREAIVAKIESLGGRVTDLSTYDPKSTHLLSPKPARNEKALACMAAGKWILHISYVDKSVAAGRFLNVSIYRSSGTQTVTSVQEEEFEFGNPKCKISVRTSFDDEAEARLQSMHWWRKEISRRGYGAFNDMRAVVVAQKREQLIRVIEAGGGQIVDAKPPFNEPVHATHCLLEVRSVPDFGVYNPLAQQGILCINTLYISDFLFKTNKDVKEAILPQYSRFY